MYVLFVALGFLALIWLIVLLAAPALGSDH